MGVQNRTLYEASCDACGAMAPLQAENGQDALAEAVATGWTVHRPSRKERKVSQKTLLCPRHAMPDVEPNCGSVVVAQSLTGTAFQRFFSDGLWHSGTGKTEPWEYVRDLPSPVLLYVAPDE